MYSGAGRIADAVDDKVFQGLLGLLLTPLAFIIYPETLEIVATFS